MTLGGRFRALAIGFVGAVLFCSATMLHSWELERLFLRAPGSLSWGPALFRALLAFHGLLLLVLARRRKVGPSAPLTPASREPAWHWIVLAALTAVGLGLRLWRLNSGLWFDEVLTLVEFARPPLREILTSFADQNQHMLYSVLAHAAIVVFGESAAALRLPAVLFGVGSIWTLFLLGRRLIGARHALLACALMTVSYHHIWFSQNARGYTGLLFFANLATWLWLEALSRRKLSWWLGYSAAASLGLWTHMTMAFVLAAQALIYLALLLRPISSLSLERRNGWKPVAALLVCCSFALQLYALALPEFLRTAIHETSRQSEWTNPLWAVAEGVRSLRIGWSGTAVLILGVILIGAGYVRIWFRDHRAALLMVLPGLLGAATMIVLGHNLWPRFFFFSMGFALLVVVEGAMTIPDLVLAPFGSLAWRPAWGSGVGAVFACLLILASAVTVPKCYALPKQDFIGARDYVERNRSERDVVVTVGLAGKAYGRYFAPYWSVVETPEELDEIRRLPSTVWLVYTLPFEIKAFHPEIWDQIEKDFEVVKVFPGSLGGGEINVCREKPGQSASNLVVPHHAESQWRR